MNTLFYTEFFKFAKRRVPGIPIEINLHDRWFVWGPKISSSQRLYSQGHIYGEGIGTSGENIATFSVLFLISFTFFSILMKAKSNDNKCFHMIT